MMDLAPTFKERQHSLREKEILDATERKLSIAGYAGFTVDEIAGEVGISKPTLYLHFKSKDEMVASVVARCIQRAIVVVDGLPESMPAINRLRAVLDHLVQARFGPSGLMFGAEMPLCTLAAQAPIRSAESLIKKKLTEIIVQLQDSGSANSHVPACLLTAALMSLARDSRYEEMVATGLTTPEELRESWLAIIAPFAI
jgi:AcrR family transcriptional regulator